MDKAIFVLALQEPTSAGLRDQSILLVGSISDWEFAFLGSSLVILMTRAHTLRTAFPNEQVPLHISDLAPLSLDSSHSDLSATFPPEISCLLKSQHGSSLSSDAKKNIRSSDTHFMTPLSKCSFLSEPGAVDLLTSSCFIKFIAFVTLSDVLYSCQSHYNIIPVTAGT